jgi:hypothetical protein
MTPEHQIKRTTEGLRDALFDVLEGMRAGTVTPNQAIAAAKVACQIINTARIEIEYLEVVSRAAATGLPAPSLGAMQLGSAHAVS